MTTGNHITDGKALVSNNENKSAIMATEKIVRCAFFKRYLRWLAIRIVIATVERKSACATIKLSFKPNWGNVMKTKI